MISVLYPPPSGRCGNTSSAVPDDVVSAAGGVLEMRKSPLSLYRLRNPMTEIPPEVLETRSIPLNGFDTPGNVGSRNSEMCPNGGRLREIGAGRPVLDPSEFKSSSVTATGVDVLLAMAIAL